MCTTQVKLQSILALQKIDLWPLRVHHTTAQGLLFISVLIGYFFLYLNFI